MTVVEKQLFTDEEYRHLMITAMGRMGASTEQIRLFVTKCEMTRMGSFMLDLILSGRIEVTGYSDDDFSFKPTVVASESAQ